MSGPHLGNGLESRCLIHQQHAQLEYLRVAEGLIKAAYLITV